MKQRQKVEEQKKILNCFPPSPVYDPHPVEEVLPHLTPQQKIKLDPNYYPPNYILELEDALALVNNLIPDLTPEGIRNGIQTTKEDKIMEDRRIVVEVTKEEDDLDYYSDSNNAYQSFV